MKSEILDQSDWVVGGASSQLKLMTSSQLIAFYLQLNKNLSWFKFFIKLN